tara:strand:+ start:743 stop:1105 length:363 start_codon:yes stop_codon:yes gene_type:complete
MSDKLSVRKIKDDFSGLFSSQYIEKDSLVLSLGEPKLDHPTRTSIQIHSKHVEHSLGAYINHNCEPSAYVDSDYSQILARRDIQPNEEITIDYLQTESKMAESFYCNCCDEKLISGKDLI